MRKPAAKPAAKEPLTRRTQRDLRQNAAAEAIMEIREPAETGGQAAAKPQPRAADQTGGRPVNRPASLAKARQTRRLSWELELTKPMANTCKAALRPGCGPAAEAGQRPVAGAACEATGWAGLQGASGQRRGRPGREACTRPGSPPLPPTLPAACPTQPLIRAIASLQALSD